MCPVGTSASCRKFCSPELKLGSTLSHSRLHSFIQRHVPDVQDCNRTARVMLCVHVYHLVPMPNRLSPTSHTDLALVCNCASLNFTAQLQAALTDPKRKLPVLFFVFRVFHANQPRHKRVATSFMRGKLSHIASHRQQRALGLINNLGAYSLAEQDPNSLLLLLIAT